MAIRKLQVSFEIDVETFAKVLALGHSAMKIDVYGDDDGRTPDVPRVSHTKRDGIHGAKKQMLILEHLAKGSLRLKEIEVLCKAGGFSDSVNSCLHVMMHSKIIRRVDYGVYAITEKGRTYVA